MWANVIRIKYHTDIIDTRFLSLFQLNINFEMDKYDKERSYMKRRRIGNMETSMAMTKTYRLPNGLELLFLAFFFRNGNAKDMGGLNGSSGR